MYVKINLDLDPIITEELESYIKAMLPEQLNEALFKDKNYLDKVIRDCVKGQFRGILSEVLQSNEIKNILRDRVMATLDLPTSNDVVENES